ncbi:hypothetical protein PUN28_013179 [Cardiocondyla obscurior]|uniref:Uncharacterized protein n=1 Tax=Cardiocondyla obscurior TaxID=286306 RepID=A0AAW2FBD3_9HYME
MPRDARAQLIVYYKQLTRKGTKPSARRMRRRISLTTRLPCRLCPAALDPLSRSKLKKSERGRERERERSSERDGRKGFSSLSPRITRSPDTLWMLSPVVSASPSTTPHHPGKMASVHRCDSLAYASEI